MLKLEKKIVFDLSLKNGLFFATVEKKSLSRKKIHSPPENLMVAALKVGTAVMSH